MISERQAVNIHKALSKGGNAYNIVDVQSRLESGHAQLWQEGDSTVVTEIVQYPNYRSFNVWLAAGNLDEIKALLPGAERYAQAHGCTQMELTGRPGWTKALSDEGFRQQSVVLVKDL